MIVVRQRPTGGPQSVAIQRAGGIAAVAHHQPGRTIPRLAVQRVVLVERREVLIDVLARGKRRRHQHAHRGEQIEAAGQQNLQRVIQALRIGTLLAHQRANIRQIHSRRTHDRLARLHPAPVRADGVDLAIVSEQAERLRQPPLRRGVGGEALVEHHGIGGQHGMIEIGEYIAQPTRRGHRLVANHLRGQSHHIELQICDQRSLGTTARAEQRQLEGVIVHGRSGIDKYLPHARLCGRGQRTTGLGIDCHVAPTRHTHAFFGEMALQHVGRLVATGRIEKHYACREALGKRDTGLRCERAQPAMRTM